MLLHGRQLFRNVESQQSDLPWGDRSCRSLKGQHGEGWLKVFGASVYRYLNLDI